MAEFSEVMRNIQRRCKACDEGQHIGCTIPGRICGYLSYRSIGDANWNAVEKEVMQWAAEHSEPVYPTWADYLMLTDVIPDCDTTDQNKWFAKICQALEDARIPADIAQKLGIEPEEG